MTGKRSNRPTTCDVPSMDIRSAGIRQGAIGAHVTCQGAQCDISITWTALHFGGQRAWWKCPVCNERCAIIYFGSKVACRTCLGLAYASNRTTKASKPFARARNLRARLKWPGGIVNGNGTRPKGMHWTTYAKRMSEMLQHLRGVVASTVVSTRRIQAKLKKMGID
jgi:hypothetical protein